MGYEKWGCDDSIWTLRMSPWLLATTVWMIIKKEYITMSMHFDDSLCMPYDMAGCDKELYISWWTYIWLLFTQVNCESLSVFGASLANGGTCPTTGEEVLVTPAKDHKHCHNCHLGNVHQMNAQDTVVAKTHFMQILDPRVVRDVLSLMHSCGMYNYSGQFAFKVNNKITISKWGD